MPSSAAAAALAPLARTRTRSSFLFTLVLLLLFCQPAQPLLSYLPGLYIGTPPLRQTGLRLEPPVAASMHQERTPSA